MEYAGFLRLHLRHTMPLTKVCPSILSVSYESLVKILLYICDDSEVVRLAAVECGAGPRRRLASGL